MDMLEARELEQKAAMDAMRADKEVLADELERERQREKEREERRKELEAEQEKRKVVSPKICWNGARILQRKFIVRFRMLLFFFRPQPSALKPKQIEIAANTKPSSLDPEL